MKSLTPLAASTLLLALGSQELRAAAGRWDAAVFGTQFLSGFQHILPDGLDHLAFLVGLFFLARSFPALLGQITLFTLAHSLTLGLVVLAGFAVEPHWVEIAVGLSIAALGLEGLLPRRVGLARLRWALVPAFGFIHGLAFAHNLIRDEALRRSPAAALLGFNLGVELGQLVVIGALVLVFSPCWRRAWYTPRLARPALALIALSGLAWAVQRAA
jgi:hypothetical protein